MIKKSTILILIVSIVALSAFTVSIFLPLLFPPQYPIENHIQEYSIIGETNLEDASNQNDLNSQNWTISEITSNLTFSNEVESKIFGLHVINSTWDETNWSLSYTCIVNYEYNESFINSLNYELHIARSGDYPPCNVYFWNYSAYCYQFNVTTVWGLNFPLDSDFYRNGEIKFKLNATSMSWFSILPYGYYHFDFNVYVSDDILLYGDLGNGYKNVYDHIVWDSAQDIFQLSILWCSSADNTSWSNYEPTSTFSGFGERYIKLNISLSVFSPSYSCDITVAFQNCSFYYYRLNKTIIAYQNYSLNHIKDKTTKTFNLSLTIGYSSSFFNTSIYLYNYSSSHWVHFGDFLLTKISNLNFTNFIDELAGIKIRLIADSYNEFAISYNIRIVVKVN